LFGIDAADKTIVGRFESSATGILTYENPKKSWALLRLEGDINTPDLRAPSKGFAGSGGSPTVVNTAGETPPDYFESQATEVSFVFVGMLLMMLIVVGAKTLKFKGLN